MKLCIFQFENTSPVVLHFFIKNKGTVILVFNNESYADTAGYNTWQDKRIVL